MGSDLINCVTVIVPVKNEEDNLPACLEALKRFSNVVVVDSGSTDRTEDIALSFGVELLQFNWNGQFPKKRNWVLQTYAFTTEWVLFLDADEVVDDEFCDELLEKVETTTGVGFWISYTNYFMGRKLRHGVPQKKLACFKVGSGAYEKIDEIRWSNLDMEIHEHPILDGDIEYVRAPIEHRDYRGLARFIERHVDYAKWEAQRYAALQKRSTEKLEKHTSRQAFKYKNIDKSWFPLFYFFYTYIVRMGFMDGVSGYYYAYYKKWYFITVGNIIREQKKGDRFY
ncbi:MAG: glycosyltransferase family 2 protein [Pseudomonadota bacterium]